MKSERAGVLMYCGRASVVLAVLTVVCLFVSAWYSPDAPQDRLEATGMSGAGVAGWASLAFAIACVASSVRDFRRERLNRLPNNDSRV